MHIGDHGTTTAPGVLPLTKSWFVEMHGPVRDC
jgi:hypothetical protein